jgi:hypothetical protein
MRLREVMRLKNPINGYISILFLMLLLFCVSCLPDNNNISTNTSKNQERMYWIEEPTGRIQTTDILRFQKEIPFKIILPGYIPTELTEFLPYFVKQINMENSNTKVLIVYEAHTGPYRGIHLREENSSETWDSSSENGYVPWITHETQVFENSLINSGLSEYEKIEIIDRNYQWNWNDIRFSCRTTGYDQAEARRIIESMFE